MLARIGGSAYMMDAVTTFSTTGIDLGEKPSVISAISKYHLTERMRTVMNDAMDVHGGKGICLGPNNYLGRGYQGVPISITVEGANILTRNMMIFGQGAFRCHPYVLSEMAAAKQSEPKRALDEFDDAVFGHIGFAIRNFVASVWFSLTRGYLHNSPYSDETKRYYQLLTGYSANLAFMTDLAMGILGGSLKRRERLSARLGDVLSHLYLASATLKRYNDEGRIKDDLPLLHWALQDSIAQIETAIDDYIRNFPVAPVRWLMRAVVQPLGRMQHGPSDRVEHQIAHILQSPNAVRTRLGAGQFTSRVPNNLMGRLEATLDDMVAAEPIFAKICQALNQKLQFTKLDALAEEALAKAIITADEAALLKRAEQGRLETINVDDFDPSELVFQGKAPVKRTRKAPVKTSNAKNSAKKPKQDAA
jgi:acyl-CoA dehydrogenase